MDAFKRFYAGRTVFVTGHTGFKGAWLTSWLLELGAHVTGFSDQVAPGNGLFKSLGLESRLEHLLGDVRQFDRLNQAIQNCAPDVVFHLAAQPLVRYSYEYPLETFATNVMGTANLLHALRTSRKPVAVVVVTSDKCYENKEWVHSYREEDAVGGFDPYSASKGCAELVVSSFRRSFFGAPSASAPIAVATARAGNVIGGGDWAADRILPDCIRALMQNLPVRIRKPQGTRPWQHVLEPLSGYLWLGCLLGRPSQQVVEKNGNGVQPSLSQLCSAFNFGPGFESTRTVQQLVEEVLKNWPGAWVDLSSPDDPHEAGLLHLAIDKAVHTLHWHPVWPFETAVGKTVQWYAEIGQGKRGAAEGVLSDIEAYVQDARARTLEWAQV
ncbi:MAG: CDP-glucose 4,6-dehydratase [Verrucomicrobiota bacterium]